MKPLHYLIAGGALLALAACNKSNGWQVSGTVAGAGSDSKIAVEGFNGATWYPIDSIQVGQDGSFSYRAEAPGQYADVYRLGLNGRSIYFPADSIDRIAVKADASAFDTNYELSGTQAAEDMMRVDRRIAQAIAEQGIEGALADSLLKRELSNIILADNAGVVSYYVINKTLGGQPLYNPANRRDLAMIGATANKFQTAFPDDPRTKVLASRYLTGRQLHGLSQAEIGTIEANVLGLFEIELYDPKGNLQSLAKTAEGAGATVLCFTSYDIEQSLPYNVELNRLNEMFKAKGLKIYQVAIDSDEVEWMQRAESLPWIAVRANPEEAVTLLRTYNVGAIPLSFVIDSNGDIVERVADPTNLEAAIRKAMKN
ncbi:MAG: hypothetical protein LUD17_03760 [Bacteroidales bacterium]|nr:hypothetical protein [Bacteroidales bacterium]